MLVLSQNKATVLLETKCPFCKKTHTALFKTKEVEAWQNGTLIQNAMPNATPDEREFLITGICNRCFP